MDRNGQQSRRAQVRANVSSTLGQLSTTSSIVLTISLLFRLLKLTFTEYYLIAYSDQYCDKPLTTWITGNVVIDFLYLALLTAMLARALQRDESPFTCGNQIGTLLSRGYFVWMLMGNFWYYTSRNCEEIAPDMYQMAFWLLLLGYLYYTFPCWFCCLLCLCIPFLIIAASKWSHYLQTTATETQINQLIERPLGPEEDHDCPICSSTFATDEKISQMPCDERHFFHKDCIITWLRVNPTCPICRYPRSS